MAASIVLWARTGLAIVIIICFQIERTLVILLQTKSDTFLFDKLKVLADSSCNDVSTLALMAKE